MFSKGVALLLLATAAAAQGNECGSINGSCCAPNNSCDGDLMCIAGVCSTVEMPNVLELPNVSDQTLNLNPSGASDCGEIGQKCCEGGLCVTNRNWACASGTCVDLDSDVIDQAGCGLLGNECCGYYQDCDEDLLCEEGRCIEEDIIDQSVPIPEPDCGEIGQKCCDGGICITPLNWACASGTCVDLDSDVIDQAGCGLLGNECCGYYQDCDEDLLCEEGRCIEEDIIDQSVPLPEPDCGEIGQKCCDGGICITPLNWACASGTCVDLDSDVIDQADCGLLGNECCGYYQDCDEDLLCAEGRCTEQDILDQSVPVPEPTCGEIGQTCCTEGLECITPRNWACIDAVCVDTDELADPEAGAMPSAECGLVGLPCCEGLCPGQGNLACASGTCVDLDADIIDQADCGLLGNECCGDYGDCDEDLLCDEARRCVIDQADVVEQDLGGCGGALEACCEDSEPCEDPLSHECIQGVCMDIAEPCSARGDACCTGNVCVGKFLSCETNDNGFKGKCVECGTLGEACCVGANGMDTFCASDGHLCVDGLCTEWEGKCEMEGEQCCTNARDGVRHCNSPAEPLACDLFTDPADPKCAPCGADGAPCCMPSTVALGEPVVDVAPEAVATMCLNTTSACGLDAGALEGFGTCQQCGMQAGQPCCWDTSGEVPLPSCVNEALVCQELVSVGGVNGAVKPLYTCVARDGEPDVSYCGEVGQPCCGADTLAGKCASGATCNLQGPNDTQVCEPCGAAGQRCCPAADRDMTDPVCGPGLGCTNSEVNRNERMCTQCGAAGGACCWEPEIGYFCDGAISCTGTVGVNQKCA